MQKAIKGGIIVALVLGAVLALMSKTKARSESGGRSIRATPAAVGQPGIPRLVEIGGSQCLPCQLMKPVLEEMKKEYAGRLLVEEINVDMSPQGAREFRIRTVPTQILFDADGEEIYRHEGFISKDELLAQWRKLGVILETGTSHEKK